MTTFGKELEILINKHSMENASNTPDFILAEYMISCLVAFEYATERREEWYGKKLSIKPIKSTNKALKRNRDKALLSA